MLSTFVVNKINDHCAAAVETTKLENMGLAYGDIITFRQIFDQSSREKTYKERAEELRKKIKRSHTKEKCQTNQTIIQKCLSVNIGLKCVETNQKSKKEKYTLKTNQGYTADVKKITLCTELHESVREHYRIPNGRPTYLGLYNGKAIEMSWSLNELYQSQKEKKRACNCTSTTLNLMQILNGGD